MCGASCPNSMSCTSGVCCPSWPSCLNGASCPIVESCLSGASCLSGVSCLCAWCVCGVCGVFVIVGVCPGMCGLW